jgi:transposase
MRYAGLDIHTRVVQAVVLDAAGQTLLSERFEMSRERLERFARHHLGADCELALEATVNSWAVAEVLEPHCARLVVSNPLRTRAIAEAKIKTDRVDAMVLAQLLRSGYLPEVWQPDAATRLQRRLTTQRAGLSHDRTRIKNRIHALLHQRLITAPRGSLFVPRGRRWLASLELDPQGAQALQIELRLLDAVEAELARLQRTIAREAYQDPRARLLITLPGVDVTVAHGLLSAIGDPSRFASADRAAAYLGLVPSTHQSAEHCYQGPITKQGRGHVRWLLIQAAQHVDRHPGPLGQFFRRLARRKCRNVAVVATARKLVTIAWHMLRSNEPYRYAQPLLTQAKLSRLRVTATNRRRTGGNPKGSGRHSNYGTGQRTRRVPSLAELCLSENLPQPQPLSRGERRMLASTKLTAFHQSLQSHAIQPRRKGG